VGGRNHTDSDTVRYYDRYAEEVTGRYEAVTGGVSDFFPLLFKSGDRVLDIGAGTGRDASRLLGLGIDVHAVEPSREMRARALAAHPELTGRLFGGALPRELPAAVSGKYDGIILSAVLMHVPDEDLFDFASSVRDLVRENGKLLILIPTERADVAADRDRDAYGRLMVLRSAAQVRLLFERLGFTMEQESHPPDRAGREGTLWTTLILGFSAARPPASVT
jgi:SAM-dependent methyltransferase